MDVDRHEDAHHRGPEAGMNARPDQGSRDIEDVDYNDRRQSVIAGG